MTIQKEIRADFEPLAEDLQISGSEGALPLQQLRSYTAMHPEQAGSIRSTHAMLTQQRPQCI